MCSDELFEMRLMAFDGNIGDELWRWEVVERRMWWWMEPK